MVEHPDPWFRHEPPGRGPDGLFRGVCAGGDMAGLGVWSPDWCWQNLEIGPGIENTIYGYERGLWLPAGWTWREGRDWLRMVLAVAMEQDDGTLTLGPKFRFPAALVAKWGLPE